MSDPQDRLTAVESALAHQEMAAQDLSEMVTRQWQVIDRLLREIDRLKDRVANLEAAQPRSPADDKPPPHY